MRGMRSVDSVLPCSGWGISHIGGGFAQYDGTEEWVAS